MGMHNWRTSCRHNTHRAHVCTKTQTQRPFRLYLQMQMRVYCCQPHHTRQQRPISVWVSEIKSIFFTGLFVQISDDLSHVADMFYHWGVVFVALLQQRDQNIAAIPEESQNVKTANKAFMAPRPSHVTGHTTAIFVLCSRWIG